MELKINQRIELTQLELLKNMYTKHRVNHISIMNELNKLNEITIDSAFNFDQDHFLGTDAVEKSITKIDINRNDYVLDLGSGFGGPTRYIANKTNCFIHGIEIQKDRWRFSKNLTEKFKLEKVHFYNDDFSHFISNIRYDKCISFLSLLHSIDLSKTIENISSLLKPDALFYIEDYLAGKNYHEDLHFDKLLEFISCPGLITKDELQKLLTKNSLEIIEFNELTDIWKNETVKRFNLYTENKSIDIKTYGKDLTENSIEFARTVKELFIENAILGYSAVIRKI